MCKELNISDDYAAQHKRELGACLLPPASEGGRPMLRWEMDVARAWFASRRLGKVAAPTRPGQEQAPGRRSAGGKSAGHKSVLTAAETLTPRPYTVP